MRKKRLSGLRLDEFPGYYEYTSHARFALRPWSVHLYLDLFFAQPAEALGFKLMYSQIRHFPEFLLFLRSRRIRVVHLVRRNYLNTILSLETALAQEQWHSDRRRESSRSTSLVYLDPLSTIRQITRLERQHKSMEIVLRGFGIDYCQIIYEDLLTDLESSLVKTLRFLDLDDQNIPLQSRLQKLITKSHRETIANYDELKMALSKTCYAALLE